MRGGGEKHLAENPMLVNFDFETQRKRVFGVKIARNTNQKICIVLFLFVKVFFYLNVALCGFQLG